MHKTWSGVVGAMLTDGSLYYHDYCCCYGRYWGLDLVFLMCKACAVLSHLFLMVQHRAAHKLSFLHRNKWVPFYFLTFFLTSSCWTRAQNTTPTPVRPPPCCRAVLTGITSPARRTLLTPPIMVVSFSSNGKRLAEGEWQRAGPALCIWSVEKDKGCLGAWTATLGQWLCAGRGQEKESQTQSSGCNFSLHHLAA